ncbi:MAG: CoA transferase [Chloroflexi bacterium]|nr:CoA transferase [Chloroflexota bacterium]
MEALVGIRIVDLTEALAGPYCTMLLGDLGADVIKIERPGTGEQSRGWGARTFGGESAYFNSTNRNKRSLTLNIQSPAGRDILQRLLATADVFICNIPRRESLTRAGIDPEALREKHPRLIYCTITGYGHSGPYAWRSGYDLVAQGEGGMMSLTGEVDGDPVRYPVPLADMATGLYSAIGILAALLNRAQSGQGQIIDNSLLESQAAWLTIVAAEYFATGEPPKRLGNQHPSIVPYQVFETQDKAIIISVGSDRQWAAFCDILGLGSEVRDDPKFATNQARLANRAEIVDLIQRKLRTGKAENWLARLQEAEIPCGPINSVPDILSDPHYLARGNVVEMAHPAGVLHTLANPVRLAGTPPTYRRLPPKLGEHTEEILSEVGYSGENIATMREEGVV